MIMNERIYSEIGALRQKTKNRRAAIANQNKILMETLLLPGFNPGADSLNSKHGTK